LKTKEIKEINEVVNGKYYIKSNKLIDYSKTISFYGSSWSGGAITLLHFGGKPMVRHK
jgi:hypothetical protein